jgi:hypothetical protein
MYCCELRITSTRRGSCKFIIDTHSVLSQRRIEFTCVRPHARDLIIYTSGSQSGRYRPLGGGGFTEVGDNRYERWKGALLLSQGGASRQVVHLFL